MQVPLKEITVISGIFARYAQRVEVVDKHPQFVTGVKSFRFSGFLELLKIGLHADWKGHMVDDLGRISRIIINDAEKGFTTNSLAIHRTYELGGEIAMPVIEIFQLEPQPDGIFSGYIWEEDTVVGFAKCSFSKLEQNLLQFEPSALKAIAKLPFDD